MTNSNKNEATIEDEVRNLVVDDDDDLDDDDDEDDDDEEEDDGLASFRPITRPDLSFPSLEEAVAHDREVAGFDLLYFLRDATDEELFFERSIVLINACRGLVAAERKNETSSEGVVVALRALAAETSANAASEDAEEEVASRFRPVLDDDAFLMSLDDLRSLALRRTTNDASVAESNMDAVAVVAENETVEELRERVSSLEHQLRLARDCIGKLTKEDDGEDDERRRRRRRDDSSSRQRAHDAAYFDSYSHLSIHETMLRDAVRTEAYAEAVRRASSSLFAGRTVLDVGCGTGVLSVLAARAGARKVYALDASAAIVREARRVVAENAADLPGGEDVIEVVRSEAEAWTPPPPATTTTDGGRVVDVIVSEWMGYALLFESMLPSVIRVRNRVLKNGGTVYPERTRMWLEGATDDRLDFFDDVCGVRMTSLRRSVENGPLATEAVVELVDPKNVVTDKCQLSDFNVNTVEVEDLDFDAEFRLTPLHATDDDDDVVVVVNKLVVSFDVLFEAANVSFDTGCRSPPTHWKQTTLWIDSSTAPALTKDETLCGTFRMSRNKDNERAMDFRVEWQVRRKDGSVKCDGSIKSALTM